MTGNDILLTGLPRSGTTLVCQLLNKLPNAVALVEPMDVGRFARLPSRDAIFDEIQRFATKQRKSLLNRQSAVTRHVGGTIKDNLFSSRRAADGLRQFRATHGAIEFEKSLEPDFRLVIKHPAAFTALLPELAERFQCYAVIRNPLSALASWNSTKMPVNDGHAPAAEQLDRRLRQTLATLENRFDRQLHLIDWYFGQYRQYLTPDRILRYEDITASGGAALARILSSAGSLNEPLASRNRSSVYNWQGLSPVVERLLKSDGAYWDFYSRSEIRGLLEEVQR